MADPVAFREYFKTNYGPTIAAYRGLGQESGDGGEVGTTHRPQQRQRFGDHRPCSAQGVTDGGGLTHPGVVVDPRAASDDGDGLGVGERRHQSR